MTTYLITPYLMKGLFQFVAKNVLPASPYAYILKSATPSPLAPHVDWLVEHGLLTLHEGAQHSDPMMVGWEWNPEFLSALTILTQPSYRLRFLGSTPEGLAGAMYVTNGKDLVLAQIEEDGFVITLPQPIKDFVQHLVASLGASDNTESPRAPIRMDHKVIRLLGVLVKAGLQKEGSRSSLTAETFGTSLSPLLPKKELVDDLLQDFFRDEILVKEEGFLCLHSKFAPYMEAIQSGEQLELFRVDLPNGEIPSDDTPTDRVFFLGPKGSRCVVLKTLDGSHEVLIGRPSSQDLEALLCEVIGLNQERESVRQAASWSRGKTLIPG